MATVEELCKGLNSGDQVKAYQARQALMIQVGEAGAAGKESQKKELATKLAAELKKLQPAKDGRGEPTEASLASNSAAGDVFRALALVAADAEVPTLQECLKNIDLREMSRWCLDRMTCQTATDALIDAVKTLAGQEFRVGVINSLGRKSGSNVVAALKECLAERDPQIQIAAVEALAAQGDAGQDDAIAAVSKGIGVRGQNRVARARLRLAGAAAKSGNKDAAKKIFESVAAGKDEVQRDAAKANLAQL